MRPAFARRYDRITAQMEEAWLDAARVELLSSAHGTVVELGAGTGKNLRHYPAAVDHLVLTEPTAAMRDQLRTRVTPDLAFEVEVVDAVADRLPLLDASADVVVSTLVLCSVPDLDAAAAEVRRVLRPGGTLLVIEHVAAPAGVERRIQSAIDPVWTWLEGSCHLSHETVPALARAGFDVTGIEQGRRRGQPPLLRDVAMGTAVRG